jgi:hypothetical protein
MGQKGFFDVERRYNDDSSRQLSDNRQVEYQILHGRRWHRREYDRRQHPRTRGGLDLTRFDN